MLKNIRINIKRDSRIDQLGLGKTISSSLFQTSETEAMTPSTERNTTSTRREIWLQRFEELFKYVQSFLGTIGGLYAVLQIIMRLISEEEEELYVIRRK